MFPFEKRLRWFTAGRAAHLLAATHEIRLTGDLGRVADHRRQALRRWSLAQAVITVVLSIGVFATALGVTAHYLTALSAALPIARTLAGFFGAFTGLFGVAYLVTVRITSILEADLLGLFALNSAISANSQK